MQLGMIGLGRMGASLVRRLTRDGHKCVVYDVSPAAVRKTAGRGIRGSASIGELVAKLAKPRATQRYREWADIFERAHASARECGMRARPSGTEDIYKIYVANCRGEQHLRRIAGEAQAIVDKALALDAPTGGHAVP
jgi:hypothetical protein